MGNRLNLLSSLALIIAFVISINSEVSAQSANRESLFFPELLGTISSDSENTLLGMQINPIGDFNRDGFYDFTAYDLRFRYYFVLGSPSVPSTLENWVDSCNNPLNMIPDISGDGYPEISVSGRSSFGWKKNIYFSGAAFDNIRDRWLGADLPFPSFEAVWMGNSVPGISEALLTGASSTDAILIFDLALEDTIPMSVLKPFQKTQFVDYRAFGERIASGSFNADGSSDFAVQYRTIAANRQSGQIWMYFGGSAFDSIPDMKIPYPDTGYVNGSYRFGNVLVNAGDLDGDGYDDLFINTFHSESATNSYIFLGGTSIDSNPDFTFTRRLNNAASAGDVNHDGFDDLVASYFGPGGEVYIFLGGPNFDTIPDVSFFVSDWSGFYSNFGQGIAGIGDFNGDQIDDFAFSAENGIDIGQIFVFSGWNSSTGIGDEPTIPQTTQLKQNYPNPFNPSTTISYSVPSSSHVTLQIINSLGEIVRTLVNQRLSAGEHTTQWDGTTDTGSRVASGTYFYQLSIDGVRSAKKMVLLK